jgi:hypothetical protein
MVQSSGEIRNEAAAEHELDARLAGLLHQMRDQHVEQALERGLDEQADHGRPMSRAAM